MNKRRFTILGFALAISLAWALAVSNPAQAKHKPGKHKATYAAAGFVKHHHKAKKPRVKLEWEKLANAYDNTGTWYIVYGLHKGPVRVVILRGNVEIVKTGYLYADCGVYAVAAAEPYGLARNGAEWLLPDDSKDGYVGVSMGGNFWAPVPSFNHAEKSGAMDEFMRLYVKRHTPGCVLYRR